MSHTITLGQCWRSEETGTVWSVAQVYRVDCVADLSYNGARIQVSFERLSTDFCVIVENTPMTARDALDAEMRDVLAQLEVCSHVPANGYEPTGRSGATSSVILVGGDTGPTFLARRYGPPFHEPTAKYPGCTTDEQRQKVIQMARDELAAIRGNGYALRERPTGETVKQRDKRIVKDGEGFTCREVAISFRCGERDVARARKAAGREPEYGRHPESDLDPEKRRARVHEMKESGMTISQIRMQLGVSRSTIERDLGQRTA